MVTPQFGADADFYQTMNHETILGIFFGLRKKMPNPMPTDHQTIEINPEVEHFDSALGAVLGGQRHGNSFSFDNDILKGEIIVSNADRGLIIRKWRLSAMQGLSLRKLANINTHERKFRLYYFLSPTIFKLSNHRKKFHVSGSRNNIFLHDTATIELQVGRKQTLYAFEIVFNYQWLAEQLNDADPTVKANVERYIDESANSFLIEPFTLAEYQTLHELEVCMLIGHSEDFFIRSRAYNLVVSFFSKIINRKASRIIQTTVEYDQLIQAEILIMENIQRPPSIATIARKVGMSVATLVRKFKLIHGKSIHEYYVQKKMELAKRMILEHNITVKHMANILGYSQASAFIETFSKEFGYTPGNLRLVSKKFSFF